MHPVKFEGANDVLGRPAGTTEEECLDLIMHRGKDLGMHNYPVITSCWEMSEAEREEFLRTGRIYFRSWGHTHPMISLSVHNPVENGWVTSSTPLNPNHPLIQP